VLSRQCRYYAAATFFSLLGLYFYARLRSSKRFALLGLVVAGTLLFNVHYIYCATLLGTILAHAAWRERGCFKQVFVACALVTILASPWILWMAGMKYGDRYGGHWFHPVTTLINIGGLLGPLVLRTFPPIFTVAVLFALRRRRVKEGAPLDWGPVREMELLLLYIGVNFLALVPTIPYPFYRYIAPLLPILCLLVARLVVMALPAHRLAGPAFIALFALTGPLPDFLYELTHDYDGPVEGMVRFLREHGKAGETVAVTYDDLPLAFYTDLRVVGGLTGQDMTPGRTAEWIILRKNRVCEMDDAVRADLEKNVAWQDYEKIEVDAPDTKFGNREVLTDYIVTQPWEGHPFHTVTDAPRLVIFHRIH
jgi:hypothetical protein